MKKFLAFFKYVNDKQNLVLMWSHYHQCWGYLSEYELYSNMKYMDVYGGKSSVDAIVENVVNFRYNRFIKSTPTNTPDYYRYKTELLCSR